MNWPLFSYFFGGTILTVNRNQRDPIRTVGRRLSRTVPVFGFSRTLGQEGNVVGYFVLCKVFCLSYQTLFRTRGWCRGSLPWVSREGDGVGSTDPRTLVSGDWRPGFKSWFKSDEDVLIWTTLNPDWGTICRTPSIPPSFFPR